MQAGRVFIDKGGRHGFGLFGIRGLGAGQQQRNVEAFFFDLG